MAQFTMTVYDLQQNNFDFGLDDYEIFDENYRVVLNNAILDYYKFREIGFQHPALWRDRMKQRLSLIMRNKYNQLYLIKQTEFNPLHNVDMTETYTHDLTNTNTAKVNGTEQSENTKNNTTVNLNSSLNLTSQFPSEEMTEDDLTSNLFIDNANKVKADGTTTDNGTDNVNTTVLNNTDVEGNISETYTRINKGSSAGLPFSRAMIQFKDYLDKFELDQQVIGELKDLFMSVW